MRGFNKGKKYGGGSGKRSHQGGKFENSSQMHKAVCSKCRGNCEVPFRPTGNKPIFCSQCFKGKDKGNFGSASYRDESRGKFGDRNSKPRFDNQKSYRAEGEKGAVNYQVQFEILNAKLDKILKAVSQTVTPVKIEFEPVTEKKEKSAGKKIAATKVKRKPAAKKPKK